MSGHPCPERLLLPEALAGRLDPAEEKRVMAHVHGCGACEDAVVDIDVALTSLAVLRDGRGEALVTMEPPLTGAVVAELATRGDRPLRRRLLAVAAGLVLLAGGAAVGRELLPPRDSVTYGAAVALSPPSGAVDTSARGSVALATEGNALAVRLSARALPAAGWYECVWVSAGVSRSAGSFRATKGNADVELRVAPPSGTTTWDLQVIAHSGGQSTVVLQGSASYSS